MSFLLTRLLISVALGLVFATPLELLLWHQRRTSDQPKASVSLVAQKLRVLLYTPVAIALVAFILWGWKTLWSWYSTAPRVDNATALVAIAGACIAVWVGSLIAFTIAPRLTPGLSHGLRFLLFGGLGSLYALVANTVALRTAALLVLFVATPIAIELTRFRRRIGNSKVQVTSVLNDPPPDVAEAERLAERGRQAFEDFVHRYLYAGPHFALLAALALTVVLFCNQSAVAWASLILLARGLQLCFASLVEPFVPKFDLEFWRRYASERAAQRQASKITPSPGTDK